MPDGGSKPQTTTTMSSTAPWEGQKPLLEYGFQNAYNLYNTGQLAPAAFPNSTVVPFSNQTQQALGQMEGAANNQTINNLGTGAWSDTVSGNMLSSGNPYFSGMMDQVQRDIQPRLASMFAGAGNLNSSMHQQTAAKALADSGSALAFQNYNNERQRQLGAMQLTPQMMQQQFINPQMLQQVGAIREGQAGAELQDQIRKYEDNATRNARALQAYQGLISGNYGQTTTQQQPIYSNNLATYGGLGLGLAGLGLNAYKMFG